MAGQQAGLFTKDTVLVMAATFLFQFSTMAVNPLINGYARSLGASSAFAGIVVGVMNIVSMILRPVAGNLTDRISKYRLTFFGGSICFIGTLGDVFAPNPQSLLLFRFINGIGFVFCTVCMATWIAFLVPRDHVGEAMGYYGLLNASSMALAPALAINLYRIIGYRPMLAVSAAAVLLMVVLIQFVGNPAQPKYHPQKRKGPRHFKIIQRDTLAVAAIMSLLSIPYFATQADIVMYVAQRRLNIAVGMYFFIYAVVLFAIRIALKNFFDTVRFGVWFVVCTVATVGYLIFLTIMDNNWEMAIAAGGMALGYGIMFSICQSTSLLLAPLEEQGLANSTFYLGLDIGMSLGPILGGLIDNYLPLTWFYPVMLVIIPIILIIYLVNYRKLNGAIEHH